MSLEHFIKEIEAITDVDKAKASAPFEKVEAPERSPLANQDQFTQVLADNPGKRAVQDIAMADGTKPTLMEEIGKLNSQVQRMSDVNPADLKKQSADLIAKIETFKTELSGANANVRPAYQTLLRNRLEHIDDSLKIALSKAGVEYISPDAAATKGAVKPIERFIGMLSNSQYQLEHLSTTIDQLQLTDAKLSPASMLAIQIKVGYVQQQIELFTNLLNKSLESIKTIMNVQV